MKNTVKYVITDYKNYYICLLYYMQILFYSISINLTACWK